MFNRLKPKSEFARSVLTLMTGTTIAQAIPIAISPILTRLYSPEDFGIFALYIGIASIVSVFATGRYELAVILPKKQEEAINIVALSILIATLIAFIAILIIWLFHKQLIALLGSEEIVLWLYFIPLTVWLNGLYQAFYYWLNRNSDYKSMSKSVVLQSSSNATGNLSLGYSGFGYSGLIITNIITSLLSLLYIIKQIGSIGRLKKSVSLVKMKELARSYKQFPIHTLPQNFVYEGSLQLPIFLIKVLYSLKILGFFSLAYRMVVTPISIISSSIGKVYYQKASVMYSREKDKLYNYTKSMFIKLLSLATVVGLPIFFFLPELFTIVFGEKWQQAGEISQYLMIYLILVFALTPFTNIYLISNNNKFFLLWEMVRFLSYALYFTIVMFVKVDIDSFFMFFSLINLLLYSYLSIPILSKNSIVWRE